MLSRQKGTGDTNSRGWAGLRPASRTDQERREQEEVQGIAIREQDLFDKLVWMSTASCVCDHTDSSAPNMRPRQSLTHASEEKQSRGSSARALGQECATEPHRTSIGDLCPQRELGPPYWK